MSTFRWSDEAVREALELPVDLAEPDLAYARVSTDSRTIEPGDLYVALIGERFDGHDFVADALENGAVGAVVSLKPIGELGGRLYLVADTLRALGRLAAYRRQRLTVPVVGITGSSGKTTTKQMTAAALGATLRVHATEGNRNNRIGMPLTILDTPEEVDVLVLEMGTNEPGEIGALGEIARPDIGVVTTVGESHLEKLGSIEGVLQEKLDLLRHVAPGGRCIVGDEPAMLPEHAHDLCDSLRVVGWSERADVDSRPENDEVDPVGRHTFGWRGQRVTAPMLGRHAVTNALMALTIAELLGVAPVDAIRGLGDTTQAAMRGEFRRIGDLTIIVDCYNANPQSVRGSLEILEAQEVASRKVAVLGTMLELGDASNSLHAEVLEDALARDIDVVVATGGFAEAARDLLDEGSASGVPLMLADAWEDVYPELRDTLQGDEVVLLKASRGVALERLLPRLEADFGGSAGSEVVEA